MMASASGWSWGSAWGDEVLDEQDDEAGGRVSSSMYMTCKGGS